MNRREAEGAENMDDEMAMGIEDAVSDEEEAVGGDMKDRDTAMEEELIEDADVVADTTGGVVRYSGGLSNDASVTAEDAAFEAAPKGGATEDAAAEGVAIAGDALANDAEVLNRGDVNDKVLVADAAENADVPEESVAEDVVSAAATESSNEVIWSCNAVAVIKESCDVTTEEEETEDVEAVDNDKESVAEVAVNDPFTKVVTDSVVEVEANDPFTNVQSEITVR